MTHADDLATLDRLLADKNMTLEEAEAVGRVKEMAELLPQMELRKDDAYDQRNRCVAVLARLLPSGIAKTAIEGWSEDWHNCVYIDSPAGQLSWHYHDSHAFLFDGLPPYTKPWDGHTTPEKYERMMLLLEAPQPGGREG